MATTFTFDADRDYCPVPAEQVVAALGEAGMAAVCVSEKDIARMPHHEVASLLATLEDEDDPQVAQAACDARELLCPDGPQTCTCTLDALKAFLAEAGAALLATDAHAYAFVQFPNPDGTPNTRESKTMWPDTEEWRELCQLRPARDARRTRVSIAGDPQRITITFDTAGGTLTHELFAVPSDIVWDVLDWVQMYRTNGQPNPLEQVLSLDRAVFDLAVALPHSDVDFHTGAPEHTQGWFNQPLALMMLEHHGITTWPEQHLRTMSALAGSFTGSLAELKESALAALAPAGK